MTRAESAGGTPAQLGVPPRVDPGEVTDGNSDPMLVVEDVSE
jgi:hypothetical protein